MNTVKLKWGDEPKKKTFKDKLKDFWKKYSEGIICISIITGATLIFAFVIIFCQPKEYKIHGPVIERFATGAGYKVQPQAHIIIHSDSLQRNIDIEVTWNTYANAQIGKVLWFDLTEREMGN